MGPAGGKEDRRRAAVQFRASLIAGPDGVKIAAMPLAPLAG